MKLIFIAAASALSIQQKTTDSFFSGTKLEVQHKSPCTEHRKCEQGQIVVLNYTGRLMSDQTVFDSSKEAFSFVLGQAEVIECWDEGIKQLEIGEKATLSCPAAMAYGEVMKPGIPENSDLEFDVELLACENDAS